MKNVKFAAILATVLSSAFLTGCASTPAPADPAYAAALSQCRGGRQEATEHDAGDVPNHLADRRQVPLINTVNNEPLTLIKGFLFGKNMDLFKIIFNIISIASCVGVLIMASYLLEKFYNRKPGYEEGINKEVILWYFLCVVLGVLSSLYSARQIFLIFYKDFP